MLAAPFGTWDPSGLHQLARQTLDPWRRVANQWIPEDIFASRESIDPKEISALDRYVARPLRSLYIPDERIHLHQDTSVAPAEPGDELLSPDQLKAVQLERSNQMAAYIVLQMDHTGKLLRLLSRSQIDPRGTRACALFTRGPWYSLGLSLFNTALLCPPGSFGLQLGEIAAGSRLLNMFVPAESRVSDSLSQVDKFARSIVDVSAAVGLASVAVWAVGHPIYSTAIHSVPFYPSVVVCRTIIGAFVSNFTGDLLGDRRVWLQNTLTGGFDEEAYQMAKWMKAEADADPSHPLSAKRNALAELALAHPAYANDLVNSMVSPNGIPPAFLAIETAASGSSDIAYPGSQTPYNRVAELFHRGSSSTREEPVAGAAVDVSSSDASSLALPPQRPPLDLRNPYGIVPAAEIGALAASGMSKTLQLLAANDAFDPTTRRNFIAQLSKIQADRSPLRTMTDLFVGSPWQRGTVIHTAQTKVFDFAATIATVNSAQTHGHHLSQAFPSEAAFVANMTTERIVHAVGKDSFASFVYNNPALRTLALSTLVGALVFGASPWWFACSSMLSLALGACRGCIKKVQERLNQIKREMAGIDDTTSIPFRLLHAEATASIVMQMRHLRDLKFLTSYEKVTQFREGRGLPPTEEDAQRVVAQWIENPLIFKDNIDADATILVASPLFQRSCAAVAEVVYPMMQASYAGESTDRFLPLLTRALSDVKTAVEEANRRTPCEVRMEIQDPANVFIDMPPLESPGGSAIAAGSHSSVRPGDVEAAEHVIRVLSSASMSNNSNEGRAREHARNNPRRITSSVPNFADSGTATSALQRVKAWFRTNLQRKAPHSSLDQSLDATAWLIQLAALHS